MNLELAGPISGHFFAGNDYEWEFTVTRDGAAVDITGMTCRFTMKRPRGSAYVRSTQDSPATATATVTDGPNGVFVVAAGDDDNELLGTYEYQAQIEDSSGNRSNVLHGYFTFKRNIVINA